MYVKREIETISFHAINKLRFSIVDVSYRGLHVHKEIEMIYLLSGCAHVRTSTEEFDMDTGDISIFSAFHPHGLSSSSAVPCRLLVIQIDPEIFAPYYPKIRNTYFKTANLAGILPSGMLQEIQDIFFHLAYNYYVQEPGFEFFCISDLNRIMGIFIRHVPLTVISEDLISSTMSAERRMERIVSYMTKHFSEKITLSSLAERENLSTSYLSHFFKDNLNQSFQSYLNDLRFEHAVQLLQNTDLKIIDICVGSGFSDSKYMNKAFMQTYHMTPKEFRQACRKNKIKISVSGTAKDAVEQEYSIDESLAILKDYQIFQHYDKLYAGSPEG